jgi:hypothetical protein
MINEVAKHNNKGKKGLICMSTTTIEVVKHKNKHT